MTPKYSHLTLDPQSVIDNSAQAVDAPNVLWEVESKFEFWFSILTYSKLTNKSI